MRYRVIAPAELGVELTQAWQALQTSSEAFASPYFCPEFTRLTGQVRGDVRVAVVEEGDRPAAFFPYQRAALGLGRPVAGALSDYHGVVALPGGEWRLPELLRAADLRAWKFDHLVDPGGRFAPYVTARASSPQMDLRAGYDGYIAARSAAGSHVVAQTEHRARKLARAHGEVLFTFDDAKPDVWPFLFRLKGGQYRATGMADPFRAPWTRTLLQRICEVDSRNFAGQVSSLRVGGRLAAVHMSMRSRHVLHCWFTTYDPSYAKYSLGIVLLLRMARAAADRGARALDLGKGDLHYKQRVMTGSVPLYEGSVERGAWLRPLVAGRERAVRLIRRIEQRWMPS